MTWPSIDHSLLSPSGHVSKRARKAAMKREHDRLFPPGFWDRPGETAHQRIDRMLASARNLRDLASRGMSPRKFIREAARIEREAAAMESGQ